MQKFKSFGYLAISCLMIVSFLSACGVNSQNTVNESLPEVSAPASLTKYYDTMAELEDDASEIVEIQVNSQESLTYKDVPFTISTVSVLKSFKGNHKKGDTIRIIETGGEYTPTDKQGNPLPKVKFNLNGVPVLQPDGHEIIFLSAFEGPQLSGEAYVPLGAYQGRFKQDASGDMIQQAPDQDKVKDYKNSKADKFSDVLKNHPKQ